MQQVKNKGIYFRWVKTFRMDDHYHNCLFSFPLVDWLKCTEHSTYIVSPTDNDNTFPIIASNTCCQISDNPTAEMRLCDFTHSTGPQPSCVLSSALGLCLAQKGQGVQYCDINFTQRSNFHNVITPTILRKYDVIIVDHRAVACYFWPFF